MTVASSKPKLPGDGYTAIDTKDGFHTIKNLPIMSNVPKGTKGAPEDIGHNWLDGAKQFGQDAFTKNKICYPLHVSHHDAGHRPTFAGYFVPNATGKIEMDGEEKDALFADFKVKNSVFERIEKGELPYVSPEISTWSKKRISSVALLDTEPPHFPFQMVKIKEVIEDPSASFSADLPHGMKVIKFNDAEYINFEYFDPLEVAKDEEKKKEESKNAEADPMANEKKVEQNEQSGKPSAAPVEQAKPGKPVSEVPAVKMADESDPKLAAKFAAMQDANEALTKRLDAIEAEKKAKALEAWGLGEMAGYQIGTAAKKSIAKFAAEGEATLKEHIEMLKEVTPKDGPRTFAAAEAAMSVAVNDPKLAKFAQAGPEKLEMAAKFASEYRTLKGHGAGKGMTIKEEDYVKFQMDAVENGDQTHWGINLGYGK